MTGTSFDAPSLLRRLGLVAVMVVAASLPAAAQETPRKGGTLIYALTNEPPHLNIAITTDLNAQQSATNIFSQLIRVEKDGTLTGDLAEVLGRRARRYELHVPHSPQYPMARRQAAQGRGHPLGAERNQHEVQSDRVDRLCGGGQDGSARRVHPSCAHEAAVPRLSAVVAGQSMDLSEAHLRRNRPAPERAQLQEPSWIGPVRVQGMGARQPYPDGAQSELLQEGSALSRPGGRQVHSECQCTGARA